jgi:hypothetical protein
MALAFSASIFLTASGFAQTSSPVARVYVTHYASYDPMLGYSNPEIRAYDADSTGKLTPISGGPWPGFAMATTGSWLFATPNGKTVYSYRVAADGSLTKADSYRIANRAPAGCTNTDYFSDFLLDHTGATLYASGGFAASNNNGPCANNHVTQSYRINKTTGALTFLGMVDTDGGYAANGGNNGPDTFTGNNVYAFESTPGTIDAMKRESNGMLVNSTSTPSQPAGAGSVNYSIGLIAADPSNHLAVVEQPSQTGYKTILESYTVQPNGSVTTTNTVQNSATASPYVAALHMNYAGNLLAVGDEGGVHVYHFNGVNPITPYTPYLVKVSAGSFFIGDFRWDKANHLYISDGNNKLYVFTVTPTGYAQAPGSPYAIPNISNIVVRAM